MLWELSQNNMNFISVCLFPDSLFCSIDLFFPILIPTILFMQFYHLNFLSFCICECVFLSLLFSWVYVLASILVFLSPPLPHKMTCSYHCSSMCNMNFFCGNFKIFPLASGFLHLDYKVFVSLILSAVHWVSLTYKFMLFTKFWESLVFSTVFLSLSLSSLIVHLKGMLDYLVLSHSSWHLRYFSLILFFFFIFHFCLIFRFCHFFSPFF